MCHFSAQSFLITSQHVFRYFRFPMVNLVIYTLGHWSVLIAFSPFSPSLLLATLTALPKVTKHMGLCVLVAQLCPTLCNLMDVAHQAPLSKEFSRQEYWNELPCLLQGIFLIQESNPHLLVFLHWQMDSLPLCYLGNP